MRMYRFAAALLIALAALPLAAQSEPPASTATATAPGDDEKTIYAIGMSLWRSLSAFDLSPAEVEIVQRAISDLAAGREPAVKLEEYMPKIGALQQARTARRAEGEKARGKAYAEQAAGEAGAVRTDSGLIYLETQAGSGETPAAADTVEVHYRGTLIDGTEFDSSYKRDDPATFPLNRVIAGWTEGLQHVPKGGMIELDIPYELAYGAAGRPPVIPPKARLHFLVELIDIQ
jgi:FKBP-type peptidyl-prolyl cis-trans isomerase FkpA